MKPHKIHIFNPDTDYALASDREFYTPPKHVVALRRKLALLPALYAGPGDVIALMDEPDGDPASLEFYNLTTARNISVLTPDKADMSESDWSRFKIEPWGWNRNVRRFAADRFPGASGLPSDDELSDHRMLSHRRTTIRMFEQLDALICNELRYPVEIDNLQTAMEMFRESPGPLYFKAPWSSSGRGILYTDGLQECHVAPWISGIIRRQGSVIMEQAYQRRLDFATEWIIERGNPEFIGLSVFNVSGRGKYQSNITGSQQELKDLILSCCPDWNDDLIKAQQEALRNVIGDKYSGPAGIDMFVTEAGNINPCVELNLRHTMGMIGLLTDA